MSDHVTQAQMDAYRAGAATAAEDDALDAHLEACAECRDRLALAVSGSAPGLSRALAEPRPARRAPRLALAGESRRMAYSAGLAKPLSWPTSPPRARRSCGRSSPAGRRSFWR